MFSLLFALSAPAHAEIDPGCFELLQDGRVQGQVFVPEGQPTDRYVEYWFLYEDFRFLEARAGNSFDLKPLGAARSLEEWERAMWDAHADGRLMVSVATETAR